MIVSPFQPLPYSPAAEENKAAILAVLARYFTAPARVLEIGAGSGQHAVHFATALPWLDWQTSEQPTALPGLAARIATAALPNLPPPLALDAGAATWPPLAADHAYTANTAHILSWDGVVAMFGGLARVLAPGGLFALYGPMLDGPDSAASNLHFDAALRAQHPQQGVRERSALEQLAAACGFEPVASAAMPRDNCTLIWRLGTRPGMATDPGRRA